MSGGTPPADRVPGLHSPVLAYKGRRAQVLKAVSERTGASVAAKVMHDADGYDEIVRLRDLGGARGVVPLLDVARASTGEPVLVMPFQPDGSYADILARSGPVDLPEAVRAGRAVAGALAALHAGGLLHNDVVPSNVLRSGTSAVLTDFGSAAPPGSPPPRLRTSSELVFHAPPEILRGHPAAPASDVYQLASTLWTLIAGRVPFADWDGGRPDPREYARTALRDPAPDVPLPGIPPQVNALLVGAMAKDPAERPAGPAEFEEELGRLWAAVGSHYGAVTPARGTQPPAARPQGPQAEPAQPVQPVKPAQPAQPAQPVPAAPPVQPVQPPPEAAMADPKVVQGQAQAQGQGQAEERKADPVETAPTAPAPPAPSAPAAPAPPAEPSPEPEREGDAPADLTGAIAPVSGPPTVDLGLTAEFRRRGPARPPRKVGRRPKSKPVPGLDDAPEGPPPQTSPPQGPEPQHPAPSDEAKAPTVPVDRARSLYAQQAWQRLEGWTGGPDTPPLPGAGSGPADPDGGAGVSAGGGAGGGAGVLDDSVPDGPVRRPRWRRHLHIGAAAASVVVLASLLGAGSAVRPGPGGTAVGAETARSATGTGGDGKADEEKNGEKKESGGDENGEAQGGDGKDGGEQELRAPDPPTGVALKDGLTGVEVTWEDASGGTARYFVVGGVSGRPPSTLARTGPGVQSAQVSTESETAEYCFTVVAVDGRSAAADEVCTDRAGARAQAEAERERQEEEEAAQQEEDTAQEEEEKEAASSDSSDGSSGSSGSSEGGGTGGSDPVLGDAPDS